MGSVAANEALDYGAMPWLLGIAFLVMVPHVDTVPLWITLVAAFAWLATIVLWRRGWRLHGAWNYLPGGLCIMVCLGIWIEYHQLWGREIGVTLLFVMLALKLLELRERRDAYVVTVLAYFLLYSRFFESQSPLTLLWVAVCFLIITATMVRLHSGEKPALQPLLRQAAALSVQAVPFMLVMFVFFPRLSGPLWSLPSVKDQARTGLSDSVNPGAIAHLARNSEVAFRARFARKVPALHSLYWRGPVMEFFDGRVWRSKTSFGIRPRIDPLSLPVDYTVTLEPHQRRWVLALDAPTMWPQDVKRNYRLESLADRDLKTRRVFKLQSAFKYRFNVNEVPSVLERNLKLPSSGNPRARALAAEWKTAGGGARAIVQRALDYLRQQPFYYTLSPPLLGKDAVDELLFDSRRGFCEHYAASFAMLMRAANIPSRVVGGYQGGDVNPLNDEVIVRQSDAHVWTEVWIGGEGWVRVDPTSIISPNRISEGMAQALTNDSALPALLRLEQPILRKLYYRWEAFSSQWDQWVIGYNSSRQSGFLANLGIKHISWKTLGAWMIGICVVFFFVLLATNLLQRPRHDPAQRLWRTAMRRLNNRGVHTYLWETPQALVRRMRREAPQHVDSVAFLADTYCRVRYGAEPSAADWRALRLAVRRL